MTCGPPDPVAARLADPAKRLATLSALEAHAGPARTTPRWPSPPRRPSSTCSAWRRRRWTALLLARMVEEASDSAGLSEGIGKDGMLARQLRRKLARR